MPATVACASHADELLLAFAHLERTLAAVRRGAGQGCSHALQRELHAHLRSLRALLGGEAVPLVEDVVDAALRVLEAADPAAPLHALMLAEQGLRTRVRRQAAALQVLATAA